MKRDTRELILETSLALFNELGEPHVTTNHIADEADISPGNLYYHFRNKNDITIALFKRFIVQLDPVIALPRRTVLEAEDLWFQLHLSFELKGHYRFLYRNLIDLTHRIEILDRAFRGLFKRERESAAEMIAGLERQGAMDIDAAHKDLVLDSLMLALIYWIPFAEVFEQRGLEDSDVQVRAIAGVLQMLIPYLRQPERRQFESLVSTYLAHAGPQMKTSGAALGAFPTLS